MFVANSGKPITDVDLPVVELFDIRYDTKCSDEFHYVSRCDDLDIIRHGWVTAQNQKQADHHGENETNHLISGECRSHAGNREVRTSQKEAA